MAFPESRRSEEISENMGRAQKEDTVIGKLNFMEKKKSVHPLVSLQVVKKATDVGEATERRKIRIGESMTKTGTPSREGSFPRRMKKAKR